MSNKELDQLRNKNSELKKNNENLGAIVKDLKEKYGPLEEIETKIQLCQENLAQLEQQLGDYQKAQSVLAEEESILAAAKKKAEEIEEKNLAALEEMERLEEKIGKYQKAEEAIVEAERKAESMLDDAVTEAREIVDKAKEEAAAKKDEILAAAEEEKNFALAETAEAKEIAEKTLKESAAKAKETLESAKKEAKEIRDKAERSMQDAKESINGLYKDFEEEKNSFYEKKEIEGNARKDVIVAAAKSERDRILAVAQQDARKFADAQREAADLYEKNKHEAADRYWAETSEKCNNMIKSANEQKEKILSEAYILHDSIIEEGRKQREKENQKLIQDKQAFAATQGEVEENRILNELKQRELEQRTSELDAEVERRLNSEYEKVIQERDAAKSSQKEFMNSYKELQGYYTALRDKTKLSSENAGLFVKFLDSARNKGIIVDEALFDRLLNAETECNNLKKVNQSLSDENQKFLAKNREISASLSVSNGAEDKLLAANDLIEYYKKELDGALEKLSKGQTVSRSEMLMPVKQEPGFFVKNRSYFEKISELEWLGEIKKKSEQSGLYFTSRQLYAFHTAQKIHGMSPLVVLAGISGTGKSELPKNYAMYGGMQFVSIPVKPDWDSPASLFGYFNSIEKRFEATDLLRAIWQMSEGEIYRDQMLMVLLDEMNLAHPEQYFADMLSKLETSRGTADAEYDILLGGGEMPEHIKIGGNILWTGTMNEDETTKGLSDKVIDRSTLITFPRPTKLRSRSENERAADPEHLLTKTMWDSWHKPRTESQESRFEKRIVEFREAVEKINGHLSIMGRNLGHRVWQGIEAYVRNYPEVVSATKENDLDIAMDKAFNDAVAFKIMPKMRGLEVKGRNETELDEIAAVVRDYAKELIGDYQKAREMTTELFQWSSAEFMNEPAGEGNTNDDKR